MGESSKAVGLIPGGIVRRQGDLSAGAGEGEGLVVLKRAVLILSALNPHLAALLSAMLMLLLALFSIVLANPIFILRKAHNNIKGVTLCVCDCEHSPLGIPLPLVSGSQLLV